MIRRVAAQARFELSLTLRQGERMLVVVGIPVLILVFFSTVDVLPTGSLSARDFLVPGVVALGVISTAMVSQGIATGFERQNGVLKRLGATPLGRGGLLTAKVASVIVLEVVQISALVGVGLLLGWRPAGSPAAAVLVLAAGTVTFGAIGFALAGVLGAETNLAVSNALFLALLFLGGVMVAPDSLPGPLEVVARALPAEPMATSVRDALTSGVMRVERLAVLGAWGALAVLAAVTRFRWD